MSFAAPDADAPGVDVLLDRPAILTLVARLASEIRTAEPHGGFLPMAVMEGATYFAADLLQALLVRRVAMCRPIPITASSYGSGTMSRGRVSVLGLPSPDDVAGRNVLLIDTIVDSGATLERLGLELRALGASSVRSVCLLDKVARRTRPVAPTWRGIEAPDRFLVGYGLDLAGRHRELPFVGALRTAGSPPPGAPPSANSKSR